MKALRCFSVLVFCKIKRIVSCLLLCYEEVENTLFLMPPNEKRNAAMGCHRWVGTSRKRKEAKWCHQHLNLMNHFLWAPSNLGRWDRGGKWEREWGEDCSGILKRESPPVRGKPMCTVSDYNLISSQQKSKRTLIKSKANYYNLDPDKKVVSLDLWPESSLKNGQPKQQGYCCWESCCTVREELVVSQSSTENPRKVWSFTLCIIILGCYHLSLFPFRLTHVKEFWAITIH